MTVEGIKSNAPPAPEPPATAEGSGASLSSMLSRAAPGAALSLALLLGLNLFNYIDRFVLAATLKPIQDRFLPTGGYWNKTYLGALTAVFLISFMVFAPLFGWLADRTRRWWLIGVGVILWSIASGASGLSFLLPGILGFWVLLATRCFVGIGEAAYGPVAPAVISDLYPVQIRGRVLSWFHAAIPVGSALGFVLGGRAGFPWAFYLVVPPGILLGLLCFLMPEPPRGQTDLHEPAKARHVTLQDYRRLFRTPSYVLDTLGMTCMVFAMGGIAVWVPIYLETERHVGDGKQVNDNFGMILVIAGFISTILGGIAGDKLRKYTSGSYFLVSAVAMFLAFPTVLAVVYAPVAFIWPLIFLTCFFLFFNTGPTNTILANVTHPSLRAPAFALNIFIIHALGDAVSPVAIGFIADICGTDMLNPKTGVMEHVANLNAGFLAVSGMILLGGIFWLIGARYLGRDTLRAIHQLDDPPS
jgi:MFS transporter, Spinster family, sphingosine-1-phosphate transporter